MQEYKVSHGELFNVLDEYKNLFIDVAKFLPDTGSEIGSCEALIDSLKDHLTLYFAEKISQKKYIIVSRKHGNGENAIFWKADALGYTSFLGLAGIYTQKQIEEDPDYYNNGFDSVAIPVTDAAVDDIELRTVYSEGALTKFIKRKK